MNLDTYHADLRINCKTCIIAQCTGMVRVHSSKHGPMLSRIFELVTCEKGLFLCNPGISRVIKMCIKLYSENIIAKSSNRCQSS